MSSDAAAVVDANYAAYDARDVDAVLATLADGFVCGPINGTRPWLKGKEQARAMYAANVADYPLSLTTLVAEAHVGAVVARREHSEAADAGKPALPVLAVYTVQDGLIARLDMADASRGDTATNEAVVARQLAAYNVQDLDGHVACFADDVVVADFNGAASLNGKAAYRERYAGVFAQFPDNRADLVARLSLGDIVIDHERVFRSADAVPFEVLAIYTVRDGLIARVDFVK